MEEWRQCGRWLIDCKVLPANHRVVWPTSGVFDLAQALRDGVLLCQMLHNLSPGSVDLKEINFRPQMSQVRLALCRVHTNTTMVFFFKLGGSIRFVLLPPEQSYHLSLAYLCRALTDARCVIYKLVVVLLTQNEVTSPVQVLVSTH